MPSTDPVAVVSGIAPSHSGVAPSQDESSLLPPSCCTVGSTPTGGSEISRPPPQPTGGNPSAMHVVPVTTEKTCRWFARASSIARTISPARSCVKRGRDERLLRLGCELERRLVGVNEKVASDVVGARRTDFDADHRGRRRGSASVDAAFAKVPLPPSKLLDADALARGELRPLEPAPLPTLHQRRPLRCRAPRHREEKTADLLPASGCT